MIAQLDKEKEKKAQTEFSFAQNLKTQIEDCEEKLDKLLDAHLGGVISQKEYAGKKQKILNQKIEISEKLKDFEQKGNHWLELSKNFILACKQAKIIALQGNFFEKRNFLKKIGSNRILRDRKVEITPVRPWQIPYNFAAEPCRRQGEAVRPTAAKPPQRSEHLVWRGRPDLNRQPHP